MYTLRRSKDRGHTQIDWLDSRHGFSFGDYYDPSNVHFGALRVINEDVIAGGGGFPPHPHRDMEIVTYVLAGALQHKDSLGTGSIIRPGEIQRMSAGTGIVHSEFNASATEPCHLLQIWIVPAKSGVPPSYEQKTIDPKAVTNALARIAAPDPGEHEVRLVQDAEIWAARLNDDAKVVHRLKPGRRAWIQVARGTALAGPELLRQGDAVSVTDESEIAIRAASQAEILLFDLA